MRHQVIDLWWSWIVPLSWQLAIWILLIASFAWLARKASPQVRYVLWTLVFVKLLPAAVVGCELGFWQLGA